MQDEIYGYFFDGDYEAVASLKVQITNLNFPDNIYNRTYLIVSTIKGYVKIVKYLVSKDVDLNHKDNNGCVALHYAVMNGYNEIVECLLDKEGIAINAVNKNNESSLHLAVRYNRIEIIKLLLSHGINTCIVDKSGRTAEDYIRSVAIRDIFFEFKDGMIIIWKEKNSINHNITFENLTGLDLGTIPRAILNLANSITKNNIEMIGALNVLFKNRKYRYWRKILAKIKLMKTNDDDLKVQFIYKQIFEEFMDFTNDKNKVDDLKERYFLLREVKENVKIDLNVLQLIWKCQTLNKVIQMCECFDEMALLKYNKLEGYVILTKIQIQNIKELSNGKKEWFIRAITYSVFDENNNINIQNIFEETIKDYRNIDQSLDKKEIEETQEEEEEEMDNESTKGGGEKEEEPIKIDVDNADFNINTCTNVRDIPWTIKSENDLIKKENEINIILTTPNKSRVKLRSFSVDYSADTQKTEKREVIDLDIMNKKKKKKKKKKSPRSRSKKSTPKVRSKKTTPKARTPSGSLSPKSRSPKELRSPKMISPKNRRKKKINKKNLKGDTPKIVVLKTALVIGNSSYNTIEEEEEENYKIKNNISKMILCLEKMGFIVHFIRNATYSQMIDIFEKFRKERMDIIKNQKFESSESFLFFTGYTGFHGEYLLSVDFDLEKMYDEEYLIRNSIRLYDWLIDLEESDKRETSINTIIIDQNEKIIKPFSQERVIKEFFPEKSQFFISRFHPIRNYHEKIDKDLDIVARYEGNHTLNMKLLLEYLSKNISEKLPIRKIFTKLRKVLNSIWKVYFTNYLKSDYVLTYSSNEFESCGDLIFYEKSLSIYDQSTDVEKLDLNYQKFLKSKMKKCVVIRVDSFNPPTIQHLKMYDNAYETLQEMDYQVICGYFIPNYKSNYKFIGSRKTMINCLVQDHPSLMLDAYNRKNHDNLVSIFEHYEVIFKSKGYNDLSIFYLCSGEEFLKQSFTSLVSRKFGLIVLKFEESDWNKVIKKHVNTYDYRSNNVILSDNKEIIKVFPSVESIEKAIINKVEVVDDDANVISNVTEGEKEEYVDVGIYLTSEVLELISKLYTNRMGLLKNIDEIKEFLMKNIDNDSELKLDKKKSDHFNNVLQKGFIVIFSNKRIHFNGKKIDKHLIKEIINSKKENYVFNKEMIETFKSLFNDIYYFRRDLDTSSVFECLNSFIISVVKYSELFFDY